MTDIEHETDIEKLRARAIELYLENEALQQRLAELIERLSRATDPAEVAELRSEIAKLKAKREKQAKKLFGKGSERRTPPPGAKPDGPKKDQTGHGPTPQPDLDVVPQVHKLDDTTCPECGGQLVAIPGEFETHDEIDVEPRKPIIRRHRRQKYACQCRECVETAPGPTKLIPGGRYSVRFAALVAVDKYDAVIPLERQCKLLGRLGLKVASQTLFDQLWAMACHLKPTYEALREHIVTKNAFLAMDETLWRMLEGDKAGRWYVWGIVAPDAVWYGFDPSRGAKVAERFLEGFVGTLMTDGYVAYKTAAATWAQMELVLKLVHCWSHVRRGFIECERDFPEATKVIQLIDQLFVTERKVEKLQGQVRLDRLAELRSTASAATIAQVWAWLDAQKALPGSKLHEAIQYALNHWTGLTVFLTDTAVPLTNNAAERAMRDPVLGRKSHYGSHSERGTTVSALFYTLIETAQMCGLDPFEYLAIATERAILEPGKVTLPQDYAAELLKAKGDAALKS